MEDATALGLIPARAGKTAAELGFQKVGGAHPRAGGENPPLYPSARTAIGSSPRGRGKLVGGWANEDDLRLIPARAGKTISSAVAPLLSAAHPRAGGEN